MDEVGRLALQIAREAVSHHLGESVTILPPADVPSALEDRAGVFVTIRKGVFLRGCIGTLTPTQRTVAHEIIANAIAAATTDPRFSPAQSEELPRLNFAVDIVRALEPVSDPSHLNPLIYGVVVEADPLKGVLLPGVEGVKTAEQQIEIARAKAGIPSGTPVTLHRFAVTRYREELS